MAQKAQKKPNKAGRPPLPSGSAKDTMLRVRITQDERAAFETAAKDNNQTVSEWIRSMLNSAIAS